jgi:DNA-binding IclR family transcriptional regulator
VRALDILVSASSLQMFPASASVRIQGAFMRSARTLLLEATMPDMRAVALVTGQTVNVCVWPDRHLSVLAQAGAFCGTASA